jgi:glutaminase
VELLDPFFDPALSHVSTGTLPVASRVDALVAEAHSRFAAVDHGEVSSVYPALARAAPELFGITVVDTDGRFHVAGDADHRFTIMSVSKPFVFALVCECIGATGARARLGVNATGRAFNSLAGIETSVGGYTNPMVNAGAIATTSLVPGRDVHKKWQFILQGLSSSR